MFSEVDGNEVLQGLRKGGAVIRPNKHEILLGDQVSTLNNKTSIEQRRDDKV